MIVGATGDLAQRKLIPALYNLHISELLPVGGDIIGAAPFDWNDQRFSDLAEAAVKQFRERRSEVGFTSFAERLHFVSLGSGRDLSAIKA